MIEKSTFVITFLQSALVKKKKKKKTKRRRRHSFNEFNESKRSPILRSQIRHVTGGKFLGIILFYKCPA